MRGSRTYALSFAVILFTGCSNKGTTTGPAAGGAGSTGHGTTTTASVSGSTSTTASSSTVSSGGVKVGVWVKPASGGGPATIDDLEAYVGRTLDYALHYEKFDATFPDAAEQEDASKGRIPIVSLGCDTPANVASGALDAVIDTRAAAYAQYGKPILVRYCWEMNLVAKNIAPTDFIAAWKHLHDRTLMRATNVSWYFCPSEGGGMPYYPGDAYVDYAGWDGYDRTGAGLSATLKTPYQAYASINKPFIVGETGAKASLNQATYLDANAGAILAQQFPKIVGVDYFDAAGAIDWSFSAVGVASFKAFARSP